MPNSKLVKGAGCGTRQWNEPFILTDNDGVAVFGVDHAGNVTCSGTLTAGATVESGGAMDLPGNLDVGGNLDVTGDTSLAALDCEVLNCEALDASGDMSVGGDKFTVAAASGDTAVAGTLDITGQATFTVAPIVPIATPASADAAGVAGQIKFDNGHIYICVATNTWLRAAAATWE